MMQAHYNVDVVTVFDDQGKQFLTFMPHDSFHRIVNLDRLSKHVPSYAMPHLVNIEFKEFAVLPSGIVDRQTLLQVYRRQQDLASEARSHLMEKLRETSPLFAAKLNVLLTVMDEALVKYYPPCLQHLKENTFFSVGGSSLNAIAVVSRLAARGLHVSIPDFLASKSLFDLVNILLSEIASVNPIICDARDSSFDLKYEVAAIKIEEQETIARFIRRNFDQATQTCPCVHQN